MIQDRPVKIGLFFSLMLDVISSSFLETKLVTECKWDIVMRAMH